MGSLEEEGKDVAGYLDGKYIETFQVNCKLFQALLNLHQPSTDIGDEFT